MHMLEAEPSNQFAYFIELADIRHVDIKLCQLVPVTAFVITWWIDMGHESLGSNSSRWVISEANRTEGAFKYTFCPHIIL